MSKAIWVLEFKWPHPKGGWVIANGNILSTSLKAAKNIYWMRHLEVFGDNEKYRFRKYVPAAPKARAKKGKV